MLKTHGGSLVFAGSACEASINRASCAIDDPRLVESTDAEADWTITVSK